MSLGRTLILSGIAVSGILGQHQHPEETSTAPKAVILEGLGNTHHVVSTANAEAQRFFDQGLGLIYAFNHEEAARSFQRAAELDPNCAMAYWGIALAVGPNYNDPEIDATREKTAVEAIQHALSLAEKASANEQAYIRALAKRYPLDPQADHKRLGADYSRAMAQVAKDYPEDLDAATLYAESAMNLHPWQLWTADGKPAEGTLEILETLRSVLQRNPRHVGANHYYIHATEASPQPEQALASAERLKTLAPAAGHLVHMPAHTYMRLGDYQAASQANEIAANADRAYIEQYRISGMYPAMYYSHNLHFLAVSASMEGRFKVAEKAAREVSDRATAFAAQMPMAEWFVPTRMFVLVRFRRWNDISGIPEPDAKLHLAHAAWRFARGMSFAGAGKLDAAQAERDALATELRAIPPETPFGFNSASQLFQIATNMLDASVLRARGDNAGAAESLTKAAEFEDRLNYDEPPDWYLPARESLGGVLFTAGKYGDAETAFRDDLKHHPKNPRSLFGLAECLRAQRQSEEARKVHAEFASGWKKADVKLKMTDL